MNRLLRNLGLYLIFIVLVISMVNTFFSPQEGMKVSQRLSFSTFLNAVENGLVKEVVIEENTVKGIMKDGTVFTVNIVNDPSLPQILAKKGVKVEVEPPVKTPWWAQFFSSLFPTLLLIGAWIFILYHMQGGGGKVMSFGKSRAKLFLDNRPRVTFKDVAGIEEAKEELKEVIDYLKNPKKYQRMGAKIPKGILLLGSPGTGKTLLARAVAGEAEVPFFSVSGSDFVEMFVGVGAARVRDLFDQARRHAPCIIFIDEIDAVGRHRGAGLGGGHDEREQTLNQLLVEMDGFDMNQGIILIAATNRPDILDPALLRPGRFDRHIVVDKPDLKGREEILKVHCRDKPLASDVDLKVIARRTPGFVGADLANLVNEAALLAARRNKDKITMEEFEEAIDRVLAGPERRSRLISEKEKRIIAYHEAGHALVARMLPGVDPVHRISIIPRGHAALGYTLQLPTEDRYLTTKTELLNRIAVLLGGRVAEKIVFGDVTTGAQNDLERATAIAREMICEYGMSERLGPLTLGKKHRQVFLGKDIVEDRNYSEEVAYAIDQEIRQLIDKCYSMAEKVILENMDKLKRLAETLLDVEVLEGDDIDKILEGRELREDDGAIKSLEEKEKSLEEDVLKRPTVFPKPA
ncbi:MAG: ATP-dependent zinc metalloprotease FtsH [Synergistetes bacterium]|nr:ATP-dependent zinc metalloprotease FtsH [Synergistota bacterium]MCX8128052.1 ATP-dependent zinc metalloprotease FtsH [Synergistota bacterium]MDW8193090.1 ATP-dependent zinc metalloprotease FtsH [Synergistota bacterium]